MKRLTLVAFALVAPVALAQAPADKPATVPAKPAAEAVEKQAAAPAPAPTRKPNPKRGEDARHCLEQPNTTAIIKCAEEYL